MITIVGAGLSGLIAYNMLASRWRGSVIEEQIHLIEMQPGVPNNHHALLRFRSPIVGEAVHIPFKKVKVCRSIADLRMAQYPVKLMNEYAIKVTGYPGLRSIIHADGEIVDRWIAPNDFINRLVTANNNLFGDERMHFGTRWEFLSDDRVDGPVIATIPLPRIIDLINQSEGPGTIALPPNVFFNYVNGSVLSAKLDRPTGIYASLYYPAPNIPYYRASIMDDVVIIEYSAAMDDGALEGERPDYRRSAEPKIDINSVLRDFGLSDFASFDQCTNVWHRPQQYAKIMPIDEDVRRRLIMQITDEYGIYMLGRFATWRPGLLLDDLVSDVRAIMNMIDNPSHRYIYRHK